MTEESPLAIAALSDLQLADYRTDLTVRLAQSYERFRGLAADRAGTLAERRVSHLFDALVADPANTSALGLWQADAQVGTVCFSLNHAEAHLFLWDIIVAGQHRRKGLGTRMMHEVEQIASSSGLDRVQLAIEFGNPHSAGFFQSLGYRFVAISALKELNQ